MPDLFPKKIYGGATDYFNLSSFHWASFNLFVFLWKNHNVKTGLNPSKEQVFFSKENFLSRCCVSPIMLCTTWLTILLSLGKEAASNINVSQLFWWQKGRSRSTLCNDVCYSKNKNKDVAFSYWLTPQIVMAGGGGFLTKFYMGRLPPEVQLLNPFTYHFWQTRYPFLYFPLTNGLFQHTSFRTLHPFFCCYKGTLLNMKEENHETRAFYLRF